MTRSVKCGVFAEDLYAGETFLGKKKVAWLATLYGAGDGARTRDVNLGKVALYH